jgi:hypothetical protein
MSKSHKRTFYHRAGRKNKHHIKAKSRGGTFAPFNLILLDENRHAAFHLLFGNRDFGEAAQVLLRADRIKKGERDGLPMQILLKERGSG